MTQRNDPCHIYMCLFQFLGHQSQILLKPQISSAQDIAITYKNLVSQVQVHCSERYPIVLLHQAALGLCSWVLRQYIYPPAPGSPRPH